MSEERGQNRLDAEQAEARLRQFRMPDEEFAEFVYKRAVAEVDLRSTARENRRWTTLFILIPVILATFGAIFVFLGLRTTDQIQSGAASEIQRRISNEKLIDNLVLTIASAETSKLRENVESRISALEAEVGLAKLLYQAAILDIKDSFSRAEVVAVMAAFRSLQSSNEVTDRPDFIVALTNTIRSFHAAEVHIEVFELYNMFNTQLVGSGRPQEFIELQEMLIQNFAEEFLGASRSNPELLGPIRDLASALERNNYREVGEPFLMVSEWKQDAATHQQRHSEIFEDIARLSEQEQNTFFRTFEFYSQNTETPKMGRVAESFRGFMAAYPDRFAELPASSSEMQ